MALAVALAVTLSLSLSLASGQPFPWLLKEESSWGGVVLGPCRQKMLWLFQCSHEQ